MQQRGIIATAIFLAIILAAALWYSLTRNPEEEIVVASPAPSIFVPFAGEGTPLQIQEVLPSVLPAQDQVMSDVAPSAASGTTEYVIALLAIASIGGAWQLARTTRRV